MNKYKPTEKEQSFLKVLMNPENMNLTVREKAAKANVSTRTFYNYLDKPEVMNLYRELMLKEIALDARGMIRVATKEAMKGSFQHFKMLMEMAGLHSNKLEINKNETHVYIEGKNVEHMSDEELYEIARRKGVIQEGAERITYTGEAEEE